MEPEWRQWVLKDVSYYRDATELEVDLRNPNDPILVSLQAIEKINTDAISSHEAEMEKFPLKYTSITKAKQATLEANMTPLYQPPRFYWRNIYEYLAYVYSASATKAIVHKIIATKHIYGYSVLIGTILFRVSVGWILQYVLICFGTYHKESIFQMRKMLPLARYFPYLVTLFAMINLSVDLNSLAIVILYIILYTLSVVKVFDFNFETCFNQEFDDDQRKCFDENSVHPTMRIDCRMDRMNYYFTCPGSDNIYMFASNIMFYKIHRESYYRFMVVVIELFLTIMCALVINKFHRFCKTLFIWKLFRMVCHGVFMVMSTIIKDVPSQILWHFQYPSVVIGGFGTFSISIHNVFYMVPQTILQLMSASARLSKVAQPGYTCFYFTVIELIDLFLEYGFISVAFLKCGMFLQINPTITLGSNENMPVMLYITFVRASSEELFAFTPVLLTMLVITNFNSFVIWVDAVYYHVKSMNETTSTYPNMSLVIFLMSLWFIAHIISITEDLMAMKYHSRLNEATDFFTLLILFIILRLYSSNRFRRDVDFMIGTKPNLFIIVTTYAPLVLCCVPIFESLFLMRKKDFIEIYVWLILISLVYICYEIFQYGEEFGSRITPTFTFGPPNNQLRRARKLFVESSRAQVG